MKRFPILPRSPTAKTNYILQSYLFSLVAEMQFQSGFILKCHSKYIVDFYDQVEQKTLVPSISGSQIAFLCICKTHSPKQTRLHKMRFGRFLPRQKHSPVMFFLCSEFYSVTPLKEVDVTWNEFLFFIHKVLLFSPLFLPHHQKTIVFMIILILKRHFLVHSHRCLMMFVMFQKTQTIIEIWFLICTGCVVTH